MEFERIGKNTILCRLTVQEMDAYGVRMEELFTDKEKSRDFLERLVERAQEETGFLVEGSVISMQLMRLPDDSLAITFSGRSEEGIQSLVNSLRKDTGGLDERSLHSIIDSVLGLGKEDEDEDEVDFSGAPVYGADDDECSRECVSDFEEKLKRSVEKNREGKKKKQTESSGNTARIFCFTDLNLLEDFSRTLDRSKAISSKLYHDEKNNDWYLALKKGKLRAEEYQNLCDRLEEFGTFCTEPHREQYCKEHFACVIDKQALRVIGEYAD